MQCSEKKAYDYYLDAGNAVSNSKQHHKKKLYIYICSECEKFHLSSTKGSSIPLSLKKSLEALGITQDISVKKVYKALNIYEATCSTKDDNCSGDVIVRKRYNIHYCTYHYKQEKYKEKHGD